MPYALKQCCLRNLHQRAAKSLGHLCADATVQTSDAMAQVSVSSERHLRSDACYLRNIKKVCFARASVKKG